MYKNLGVSDGDIAFHAGFMYLPWTREPPSAPVVEMFRTEKFFGECLIEKMHRHRRSSRSGLRRSTKDTPLETCSPKLSRIRDEWLNSPIVIGYGEELTRRANAGFSVSRAMEHQRPYLILPF
jgi:hypothetical protein